MQREEVTLVAQRLMREADIDYLDMSLWDVAKEPEEERCKGRSVMSYFTELDRGEVRLGVAGNVASVAGVANCLSRGADFVLLGRAAILHHDFPLRAATDPEFRQTALPVSRQYLSDQGLGEAFINCMSSWRGFVA